MASDLTFRYRIYGLNVSSDTAIPGLYEANPDNFRPELFVEFAAEPGWVRNALNLPAQLLHQLPACKETQDPAFILTSLGGGSFFQLYYSDGTRFVVDAEAARIWGASGAGQTIADLCSYFLGPILGYVLRRRGITALHASAVNLEGRAVVLAGPAGAGKSTTAAALALRGAPVICEDIAALEETHGGFAVQSGYPRVCLWPESVEMLMGFSDALPPIAPNWDKRYLQLDGVNGCLETDALPLGAVYILAAREEEATPRAEDVASREILLELVQNTYMNWLLDRGQRANEFELLSRLVSRVPVRRIVPDRNPSRVGALCDLILNDASRLLSQRSAMAASAGR